MRFRICSLEMKARVLYIAASSIAEGFRAGTLSILGVHSEVVKGALACFYLCISRVSGADELEFRSNQQVCKRVQLPSFS
jgi:hypothetical protein